MINNKKLVSGSLFLLILPNLATAQIVYAPVAGPGLAIPTLTTTALLLSIVLLFIAAKWLGFDKANARKISSVLAICTVAYGVYNVKLMSEAYADGGGTNFAFFSSASGGSVPINNGVLNIFENTSARDQRLVSITLGACVDGDNGTIEGVERCQVGDVIATDEDGLCYTDCRGILIE